MDLTGLIVGLAAAAVGLIVGLLSPVITYRYMWKMDHERWVREQRADAYVQLTTKCLYITHALEGLPDNVPDIGEYLRKQDPYKELSGEEIGQRITAFGTPEMVSLMESFADIQNGLYKLGTKRDQVPPLLRKLGQLRDEMNIIVRRDIQHKRVTGQTSAHVDAQVSKSPDTAPFSR